MFTEHSVSCADPDGVHDIVYSEFAGDPAKTVICVHGLSRNGRDFDWLAESLAADGHRVICPDMAGRGRSAPFANPAYYNYAQYIADCTALLTHLQVDTVDWVGTSMGGLIGMMMAAQPQHAIRRLVINDIGPFIPRAALLEIKQYVGQNPTFDTWDAYYANFKQRMAPFGLETDEQSAYLAKTSMAAEQFKLAYDTNIIAGLGADDAAIADVDLWAVWQQVTVPVLVLHGADSRILSQQTLEQMKIGKNILDVTFPQVGHAPALMSPQQIQPIAAFLV